MAMDAVAAQALAFAYNGRPVLTDVSFAVPAGELVCLLGQNGCGKTTLLRLLLGLLAPRQGRALVAGRDAGAWSRTAMARQAAYVPQLTRPAFAYTVFETVLMGRAAHNGFAGRPASGDRDIARAALARFGIEHLAGTPLPRLSGGQRQLAMLARAVAQQAPVLIMDEPITGLDLGNQALFLEIVRQLCDEGHTCLMTTHVADHALWVADRAVLLRQGRVLADGPPETAVTSPNLHRLYNADIDVHALKQADLRVCVPARFGRRNRTEPNAASAPLPPVAPQGRTHGRDRH